MPQHYEYTFVRFGEEWFQEQGNSGAEAEGDYQEVIHQHAREGWRLVQIFAPESNSPETERYYELIFERQERDED